MYKIVISEIIPKGGEEPRYPETRPIYEQTVDTIDIPAIVAIVNKIQSTWVIEEK